MLLEEVDERQEQILASVFQMTHVVPRLPEPSTAFLRLHGLTRGANPMERGGTNLGLRRRILRLTLDENGNVVFALVGKDIVGHGSDLDAAHAQARLLEHLTLGTGEEGLAILKVAARQLPRAGA
ncbi:hypothetical protein BN1708_012753, partial [Verticillium longisporum]